MTLPQEKIITNPKGIVSEVYNMDCVAGMKEYPDGYFELAIVDPPFGGGIMKKNKYQRHGTRDTTYRNKEIPSSEYFNQLYRVSKNQIIFGCQYMMKFLKPEGSFVVWDKGADPDKHNMSSCDIAWFSKRERIKKLYAHWCGAVR